MPSLLSRPSSSPRAQRRNERERRRIDAAHDAAAPAARAPSRRRSRTPRSAPRRPGCRRPTRRRASFKGTGVVVKGQQPGGGLPPGPPSAAGGRRVVLNFEGADLREVVRNILGDIMNESYTIDPAVGGQVTIRTSSGIPREALIATLETLLRMNGATMVKEAGSTKSCRAPPACAAMSRRSSATRSGRCLPDSRCRSCRCATSACAR